MIELQNPALEIRITIAGLYLAASVPERVVLQALAFALSWPCPPWEQEARLNLQRAIQEETESRQFLQVARSDEKADARAGLLQARVDLQRAHMALDGLRPQLRDVHADGRTAMERLAGAQVPPATWTAIGSQLLSAWLAELLPAQEEEITALQNFTLPRQALTSAGDSSSPATTAETPSGGIG